MLRSTLLCFLVGSLSAFPLDEPRSNLEFLDYSTNLDEPAYRLRNTVYPHNVTVNLDVHIVEARFDGFVSMDIEVNFIWSLCVQVF